MIGKTIAQFDIFAVWFSKFHPAEKSTSPPLLNSGDAEDLPNDPVFSAKGEATCGGGGWKMLPPTFDWLYPLLELDLGNVADRNGVDAEDEANGEVVRS